MRLVTEETVVPVDEGCHPCEGIMQILIHDMLFNVQIIPFRIPVFVFTVFNNILLRREYVYLPEVTRSYDIIFAIREFNRDLWL